ncbi:hypothetical protein [Rhodopseudomonas palustris]|uniref:hypothetical protein n=1 Tax=Rhodopseudomonas palustris TaxID=1076 RepID=UPI0009B5C797
MIQDRRVAVVTGASTGIGYELAKCCGKAGYDLLIAADESVTQHVCGQRQPIGRRRALNVREQVGALRVPQHGNWHWSIDGDRRF